MVDSILVQVDSQDHNHVAVGHIPEHSEFGILGQEQEDRELEIEK